MARAWAWVSTNHDAFGAVVAAFGVLVATLGVFVGYAYVRLTRKLAVAANRQADLTQALFETGHRPWLTIACKHNRHTGYRDHYPTGSEMQVTESQSFTLTTENKGSVPAVITFWQVVVEREGDEPMIRRSQGEAVVYPGGTERLGTAISISDTWEQRKAFRDGEMGWEGGDEQAQAARKPMRVEATVRYRGVIDKPYSTHVVYRAGQEATGVLRYEEIYLDTTP